MNKYIFLSYGVNWFDYTVFQWCDIEVKVSFSLLVICDQYALLSGTNWLPPITMFIYHLEKPHANMIKTNN